MCKVKESPPQVSKVAPAASLEELLAKKPFVGAHEPQKDFHWVATDEPHATRRKLILAKYPQIKELFGHCTQTKWVALFVVLLQTYCAYQAQFLSMPAFLALAYIVGGTANHNCMMAMHELSHNLGFKKMIYNRMLGIFANLPIGVPSAVSFKRYHMEHHRYQGEEGVDVDLPTAIEGKIFNNTVTKFFFVVFQVLFYAFRPLVVNPKSPGLWEMYNWIACMSYNFFIYQIGGGWSVAYLFISSLFGSGIHPVAGHFIAEHYVFVLGYETYSYYGILNLFTYNVGYHNEHHDFPYVPGSRLHRVRAIAPEFYENLPQHESWVKVMFDYVFDKNIGAFSRVKRHNLTDEEKNKMKTD